MKRIISFLIDYGLATLGMGFVTICIPGWYSMYGAAFIISLFFCRDCISGQSIGRRIMHIRVVHLNQPISPLRAFIRNLFLLIWPLEIITLLITRKRRLADMIVDSHIRAAGNRPLSINPTGVAILLFINVITSVIIYLWISADRELFRYLYDGDVSILLN